MTNFFERTMPPKLRMRFKNLVATALGLFLALRYNDFIRSFLDSVLPEVNGLFTEFMFLVLITVVVVYIIAWVEQILDGK